MVIHIQGCAFIHLHRCTVCNIHLNAGQQSHILGDLRCTGKNVQCHAVRDGQNIVAGTHCDPHDCQGQIVDLRISRNIDLQSVLVWEVLLCKISAFLDREHGALIADEMYGCRGGSAGGINGGVDILIRAGFQNQLCFNVLNKILVQREDLLGIVIHAGGRAAAAEIADLHILVYSRAGFRRHRTVAGHIAVDIQSAAAVDGDAASAVHIDVAVFPARCACACLTVGIMFCADADGTVHRDGSALRHGQGLIDRGCCPDIARIGRGSRIAGVGAVKGNQEGNAAGNAVAAAVQRTVRYEDDLAQAVRHGVFVGLIQVGKLRAADVKNGICFLGKHSRDRLVDVKIHRGRRIRGQVFFLRHAVPADELVAGSRRSGQAIGHSGLLGFGGFCCDLHAVHRIAAVFRGLERGGGLHVGDQGDPAEFHCRGICTGGGFQINLDRSACRKLSAVRSIGRHAGASYLDGAAVVILRDLVGKRQNGGDGFVVRDR